MVTMCTALYLREADEVRSRGDLCEMELRIRKSGEVKMSWPVGTLDRRRQWSQPLCSAVLQ